MIDYHLIKIRQHFNNNSLLNLEEIIAEELLKLKPLIKPGARIALAVGSRGIRDLLPVVQKVAEFVKENMSFPFIVPAMGSHGGATAEGQQEILAGYGITEKNIGIPVRSSMEVVELAQGNSPIPVFMDRNAYNSDGIILINRIKPHTDYHGRYESGLVKMSVIGLGKEKQASAVHKYGVYGLSNMIPLIAEQIYSSGKILGGIALIENAFDKTMLVKALEANDFLAQEPGLLDIARENMPSLPVDEIDVLIIDQMGKDISGVGIDPNIIGRIRITGQEEPTNPNIKAIVLSDLTDNSHGNAIGIGLADVISRKLYNKIDFPATYTNAVTSGFLERAKVPVTLKNDKEALELALRSCAYIREGEEKIIRIKNTLHIEEMYVSSAIWQALKDSQAIEIVNEKVGMFNQENNLNPF